MEGTELILGHFPDTTPGQLEAFGRLGGLYREWNSKINVISRKDIDSIYVHHILHSLGIAAFIRDYIPELYAAGKDPDSAVSVLDLGTGGGFPGIPLAVMFPGFRLTLCDSIGKKVRVAQAVAQGAGLTNVETVHSRAEDLGRSFDYVVSRAVTSLDNFLPWVKGRYDKGILYLKGGDIIEEVTVAAQKNKLKMNDISIISLDRWFKEEYFSEKKVVFICKSN